MNFELLTKAIDNAQNDSDDQEKLERTLCSVPDGHTAKEHETNLERLVEYCEESQQPSWKVGAIHKAIAHINFQEFKNKEKARLHYEIALEIKRLESLPIPFMSFLSLGKVYYDDPRYSQKLEDLGNELKKIAERENNTRYLADAWIFFVLVHIFRGKPVDIARSTQQVFEHCSKIGTYRVAEHITLRAAKYLWDSAQNRSQAIELLGRSWNARVDNNDEYSRSQWLLIGQQLVLWMFVTSRWGELIPVARSFLQYEDHADFPKNTHGLIYYYLSRAFYFEKKYAESRKVLLAGIPILKQLSDFPGLLHAHRSLIEVFTKLKDFKNADLALDNALYYLKTHSLHDSASQVYTSAGYLAMAKGLTLTGIHWYELAYAVSEESNSISLESDLAFANKRAGIHEKVMFWLDKIIEKIEKVTLSAKSIFEIYEMRAQSARATGRTDEAIDFYSRCLAVRDITKYKSVVVMYELGKIFIEKDKTKSLEYLQEVVAPSNSRFLNESALLNSHFLLSQLFEEKEDFIRAFSHCQDAADLTDASTSPDNKAQLFMQLGRIAERMDDLSRALLEYERAIPLVQSNGNEPLLFRLFSTIGFCYKRNQDPLSAYKFLNKALGVKSAKQYSTYPAVLNSLGIICLNEGYLEEAKKWLSEYLDHVIQKNDRTNIVRTLISLANLETRQNSYEASIAILERALTFTKPSSPERSELLRSIGVNYHLLKDLHAARSYYDQAMDILGDEGNNIVRCYLHHQLGMLAKDKGEVEEAEKWFRKSLYLKEAHNLEKDIAKTLTELSGVLTALKRFNEAERYGKRGLQLAEKYENENAIALALMVLGELYRQSDNIKEELRCEQRLAQMRRGNAVPRVVN